MLLFSTIVIAALLSVGAAKPVIETSVQSSIDAPPVLGENHVRELQQTEGVVATMRLNTEKLGKATEDKALHEKFLKLMRLIDEINKHAKSAGLTDLDLIQTHYR